MKSPNSVSALPVFSPASTTARMLWPFRGPLRRIRQLGQNLLLDLSRRRFQRLAAFDSHAGKTLHLPARVGGNGPGCRPQQRRIGDVGRLAVPQKQPQADVRMRGPGERGQGQRGQQADQAGRAELPGDGQHQGFHAVRITLLEGAGKLGRSDC